MKLGWPRFLPRLPALLLIPALVPAWASLLWVPESSCRGYERGVPLVFEIYRTEVRSVVLSRTATMITIAPGHADRSEFRVPHFLADLAVALVAAYILTMAVERLLFPMIRGVRRRNLGQRETN